MDIPPENIRCFISSTYEDLKEYRSLVEGSLRPLGYPVGGMKLNVATDKNATDLSILQLEECNVYIGIIGNRYGTPSTDKNFSIVQQEYHRAVELHKENRMRLLFFLLDEKAPIQANLIGKSISKQKKFRAEIERKHRPLKFANGEQLLIQLHHSLLALRSSGDHLSVPHLEFVEEGDLETIKEKFDLSDEQKTRIDRSIELLAKLFKPLFTIEPSHFNNHELFNKLRRQLKNVIPGVSLDIDEGILKRTGVQHVILRRETAVTLVQFIEDPDKREEAGRIIGASAAASLITNTIEKRLLIPASAKAFITLLDYWDRTGGWGKLTVIKPRRRKTTDNADQELPSWRIQIDNNFLYVDRNPTQTHALCRFWCGYLHGLLDQALPRIHDLMLKHRENNLERVTLPAYSRVKKVVHESENDRSLKTDRFLVTFEPKPLWRAMQSLSDARSALPSDFRNLGRACREAIHFAVAESKSTVESLCGKGSKNVRLAAAIKRIHHEDTPYPGRREEAKEWFDLASEFVELAGKRLKSKT